MRITRDELTVNFQTQDENDLLEEWRWLLGDSMQLFLVSAMGDMFLGNHEGHIFWLDTGAGRLDLAPGTKISDIKIKVL